MALTEPARFVNRPCANVWFVPIPGVRVVLKPVIGLLDVAPSVACGVMLLSFHPIDASRRNSTPAFRACLPTVQLKLSPYCQRGLREERVEPNPADQFIKPLEPR